MWPISLFSYQGDNDVAGNEQILSSVLQLLMDYRLWSHLLSASLQRWSYICFLGVRLSNILGWPRLVRSDDKPDSEVQYVNFYPLAFHTYHFWEIVNRECPGDLHCWCRFTNRSIFRPYPIPQERIPLLVVQRCSWTCTGEGYTEMYDSSR